MDTYIELINSDITAAAFEGIEYWTGVLMRDDRTSKARGALQYLAPVLMQKLTKQDDSQDSDFLSVAVSVCLTQLSLCCGDDIVPHVLPFINTNIKNDNWRYREAALKAFGSILEGLDANTVKPLVQEAMPTLFEAMYDSSVAVRDAAAWTFSRICKIAPEAAINETYLKPLLEILLHGLKAEPRVAEKVCWALSGLAEGAYKAAEEAGNTNQPKTYCMSKYFDVIIQQLIETTEQQDMAKHNLRSAAYGALSRMLQNSPADCYATVQKTTMVILERLKQVLQMENQISSDKDRSQFRHLLILLCETLQAVLPKMTPQDAPHISDAIMTALLTMLAGGVDAEALLAVSTLVEVLGENFLKYMDVFKRYLLVGLKTHQNDLVCVLAVQLTGDICRALKSKVLPYCDDIICHLLENLRDPSIDWSLKREILFVFGDVALSIGPDFVKYFDVVMQMLLQANNMQVDRISDGTVKYLEELRESVLEVYITIIQGMTVGNGEGQARLNVAQLLEPHVPAIVEFMDQVATQLEPTGLNGDKSELAKLAGELCSAFGPRVLETRPALLNLLQEQHQGAPQLGQ